MSTNSELIAEAEAMLRLPLYRWANPRGVIERLVDALAAVAQPVDADDRLATLEEDIHEAMLAEAMIETQYPDDEPIEVVVKSYVADVLPGLARHLAAGFRSAVVDGDEQVTTVEELDALPLNSVILDEGGLARQAWSSVGRRNWWSEVGDDGEESSDDLIEHVLACGVEAKFTVLYRPVAPTTEAGK